MGKAGEKACSDGALADTGSGTPGPRGEVEQRCCWFCCSYVGETDRWSLAVLTRSGVFLIGCRPGEPGEPGEPMACMLAWDRDCWPGIWSRREYDDDRGGGALITVDAGDTNCLDPSNVVIADGWRGGTNCSGRVRSELL